MISIVQGPRQSNPHNHKWRIPNNQHHPSDRFAFLWDIAPINYEVLLHFRHSISHQIEEDHPQSYNSPIFGYTKYDQLFLGLSVNPMNLRQLQWLADLLGARKEMIHILNKNHGAH